MVLERIGFSNPQKGLGQIQVLLSLENSRCAILPEIVSWDSDLQDVGIVFMLLLMSLFSRVSDLQEFNIVQRFVVSWVSDLQEVILGNP